jgi:thioredoxin 1
MATKEITTENFASEVELSDLPVLVEFTASWCVYCRRIAPALTRLADKLDGQVTIATIDTDAQPALAERFGVETIPQLFLFQHGEPGNKLIAPSSQAEIEAWLDEQL